MSLRARLLAGMALVAVVLVVVSAIITITTRDLLIEQIDDRLASFSPARRIDDVTPFPAPDVIMPIPIPPEDGALPVTPERTSDAYQGFVQDGVLNTRFVPNVGDAEFGAPDLDLTDLPEQGSSYFTTDSIDEEVTYRVLADRFDDVVLITALPLDDVTDTISQLVWVEVLGATLILAVLGLVSWWVIRLGIRPVKAMTETATRIATGDLTVRVPESGNGTESADLAVALNRMLGHIEGALDDRAASEDRLRRFVSDASHELRTPVTTIRGYAELYRHGGLDDHDALDDAMRRTEHEAVRMGRLIEDMLVLAKFDEERPLDLAPVDLNGLVSEAAADALASWPGRPITVDVDDEPAIVIGDEDRLRQVISNVVVNALVHTDPHVAVALSVRRVDGQVTFDVEDDGQGMPPDVAERATERFYRADPARSRHRGGSGLGLSIVDAAVTAHGGTITIDTRTGSGTNVHVSFPATNTRSSPP